MNKYRGTTVETSVHHTRGMKKKTAAAERERCKKIDIRFWNDWESRIICGGVDAYIPSASLNK